MSIVRLEGRTPRDVTRTGGPMGFWILDCFPCLLPTAYCLLFGIIDPRDRKPKTALREIRRYANLLVASALEWRNWQTQQTQNGYYRF